MKRFPGRKLALPRGTAAWWVLVAVAALAGCSTGKTENAEIKLGPPLTPYAHAKRYVVAVLPFQYLADQEQFRGSVEKAADLTVEALFGTQRVRLIERTRLKDVLGEIAIGQSGVLDDATVVKVGRQLGAEAVLLGTITAVSKSRKKDQAGIAYIDETAIEVSLKARVIDMARGELLASAQASASEVAEQRMALGLSRGGVPADDALFNHALEKSVRLLAYRLAERMPEKM